MKLDKKNLKKIINENISSMGLVCTPTINTENLNENKIEDIFELIRRLEEIRDSKYSTAKIRVKIDDIINIFSKLAK